MKLELLCFNNGTNTNNRNTDNNNNHDNNNNNGALLKLLLQLTPARMYHPCIVYHQECKFKGAVSSVYFFSSSSFRLLYHSAMQRAG